MKYLPYIFPVFLLFIFNRLASALTWYYTVSNLVTLGLQFVIQNYIIDHNKILVKMEENRKKPKTKSKWAGTDGADAGAAKETERIAAKE